MSSSVRGSCGCDLSKGQPGARGLSGQTQRNEPRQLTANDPTVPPLTGNGQISLQSNLSRSCWHQLQREEGRAAKHKTLMRFHRRWSVEMMIVLHSVDNQEESVHRPLLLPTIWPTFNGLCFKVEAFFPINPTRLDYQSSIAQYHHQLKYSLTDNTMIDIWVYLNHNEPSKQM